MTCANPVTSPRVRIHGRRVEYGRGSSGEMSQPCSVRTAFRNTGTLSSVRFRHNGSSLRPRGIVSRLSSSGEVRLEAANARSLKSRPRRITCGLKRSVVSYTISGRGKVFLRGQSASVQALAPNNHVQVFDAKELLCEFKGELQQNPMRAPLRIP